MLGRVGRLGGSGAARIVLGMLVVYGTASAALAQLSTRAGVHSAAQTTQANPSPAPAAGRSTGSGLIVPRFASFKSDKVHLRNGPGTDHAIQWVYNRAGLPVEIIAETEAWRRVRDSEGTTGWVLATLLSGRRTALVEPWSKKPDAAPTLVPLKSEPQENAPNVAQVEAGVIANVRYCDGRWCAVAISNLQGFMQQARVWGVYKDETVKP